MRRLFFGVYGLARYFGKLLIFQVGFAASQFDYRLP
jgi:hypothetical protein